MKVPNGIGQVSGGESVLCWLAAPVGNVGNLQKFGNKV